MLSWLSSAGCLDISSLGLLTYLILTSLLRPMQRAGAVQVHVLTEDARAYYGLEQLLSGRGAQEVEADGGAAGQGVRTGARMAGPGTPRDGAAAPPGRVRVRLFGAAEGRRGETLDTARVE